MKNGIIRVPGFEALTACLSAKRSGLLQFKKLSYPVAVGLLLCLAQIASAQDWNWNGAGGDGLWSNPNNWVQGTVPPAGTPAQNVNAFIGIGGVTTITIAAGDVENPGTGNDANGSPATYGSIFGPEFGETLNIYGTLNYHWVVAAVDNNANRASRTRLNMYGDSFLRGVNLGIGTVWWYQGGPYSTFNMYNNAQAFVENLWWGGHVNIYDNTVLWLTNGVVDQGTLVAVSDTTRNLNLAGGQLVLPGGSGANVMNWISRGILLANGKRFATNDVVINDQGTNTFVKALAFGGALQRVYFLPETSLMAGMYRQAMLVGDYPGVSGVVLSSADPGVDLASLPGSPVYMSSNTNVVTVTTNGLLHAINPGTVMVTASVGAFSSTNLLSIVVTPAGGTLVHRYSFNESAGTTAADSVGGMDWDGALNGTAAFSGGKLVLDGSGYVQLPGGVVSNMDAITIESWATFSSPLSPGAALYGFGSINGSGAGVNYISMIPHTYPGGVQANFGNGDPGDVNLQAANLGGQTLDGMANEHIAAVYYPLGGTITLYTNGTLAATYNNVSVPLAYKAVYGTSPLPYVLGQSPINIIGASLYSTNGYLNASIDEFRIYDGPLTASQISADYVLGPNQLIGSTTSVTLEASLNGGNLVLTWPTNSALVTLTSSSDAASPGSWSPANRPLTIVGGKYQATVSPTNSARYFRLQQ